MNRVEFTVSVRYLARYPPGTPYAVIVEALKGAFAESPLQHSTLLVDQTAVGRRVFDLVREGVKDAFTVGLGVTAGQTPPFYDAGTFLVPKKDLVGVLQVLLQGKRLKVAPALEMATTLAEELQQFRLKTVPPSDVVVVEWRERPHDDLVLAVAVAAWYGERYLLGGLRNGGSAAPAPDFGWRYRRGRGEGARIGSDITPTFSPSVRTPACRPGP
jgi:hypothetical protein